MLKTLLLSLLLALAPSLAAAHAELQGSEPLDGSVVQAMPATVTLTFSEGVAPLVLRWIAPDGTTVDVTGAAENDRLTIALPQSTASGSYLLSWRVASADGHPVGGVLTLHLGTASTQAVEAVSQTAAQVTAGLRFLLSLAMTGAVGASLHAGFVAQGPVLRRLRISAALLTLPLAVVFLGLHGLDLLDLPVAALLGPGPWSAALAAPLARTVALSVLAALLALLAPRPKVALAAWLFAGLSYAASGHAVTAPPQAVSLPAMALHGMALVWWMGLLVPLLADLRHPEADLRLRRFSTVAVPLVGGLVLSGGWLTWAQSAGDLAGLATTGWGQILLAKLVLVGALLALALHNRQRLTKALAPAIRTEVVLGVLVLALAAGFRLTPPPRALAEALPPVIVHLHSERVMADLRLTPGLSGPVVLEMAFSAGDFSALVPRSVEVALTPADGRLEAIRATAMQQADGLWTTPVMTLPFAGAWEVALRVGISDFDRVVLRETVTLPR